MARPDDWIGRTVIIGTDRTYVPSCRLLSPVISIIAGCKRPLLATTSLSSRSSPRPS